MEFSDIELSVLSDVMDDFSDRLRHYLDAELGWEYDKVNAFYDLYQVVYDEAKRRRIF